MRHTPTLALLPAKLLLQIVAALEPSLRALASLTRTSRRFADLLSPVLLKRAVSALDQHTRRSLRHWAAARGRGMLLAGLLKHGATPLHSAVICGSTAEVAVLLQHGADPDVQHAGGWAPLHLAAITGSCRISGLLLDYGAKISAKSGSLMHKLPFHYAVLLGHVALVELFLAHGADVDAVVHIAPLVVMETRIAVSDFKLLVWTEARAARFSCQ